MVGDSIGKNKFRFFLIHRLMVENFLLYYIDPEIAGGFGAGTVMDASRHPPIVINLEYQLDGWLGDEVLELFPCFVLTEAVAMEISKLSLSGFSLDL